MHLKCIVATILMDEKQPGQKQYYTTPAQQSDTNTGGIMPPLSENCLTPLED